MAQRPVQAGKAALGFFRFFRYPRAVSGRRPVTRILQKVAVDTSMRCIAF